MDDASNTANADASDTAHAEITAPTSVSIELEVKESTNDDHDCQNEKTDDNKNGSDNESQQQILQKRLIKSHPSIIDVINHKVTWIEFVDVYNVLRIGIAAIIAILIILIIFAIIYALNPNKCKPKRENPDRVEWNPIAIQIMNCLELILMFGPVVKIFGYEWKWSSTKSNISLLLMCISIFIVFMPYGFIYNMSYILYMIVALSIFVSILVIYLFSTNGFYVFWMVMPFVFAFIIGSLCVFLAAILFRNYITPNTFFFAWVYSLFLTILQFIIFKFNLYSFPYKLGRFCTCPCNKAKSRQVHNYNEVTVESELSDMMIFWFSMVVISTVETFRIAEYIELVDHRRGFGGLYQFVASSIFLEIIIRNGIIWEIVYKLLLKKPVPPRTRVMSIYFGAKYQAEWIPIWCVLLMNIFGYGPFAICSHVRDIQLHDTVYINMKTEWWLFLLMFGSEIVQGIASEIVLRIARYFKLYGIKNENGEDPPRNTLLVKVNLFPMIWILIQCYIFSYESFIRDKENRSITV